MKLSTKLKLAFGVLILVPIFFCAIGLVALFNFKMHNVSVQYNAANTSYEILLNPVQMVSTICKDQYEDVVNSAHSNPMKLTDEAYLNHINAELMRRNSYLMVSIEDEPFFFGEKHAEGIFDELSDVEYTSNGMAGIYLEDFQTVINRVPFHLPDGREGEAYVVMKVGAIIPQMRHSLIEAVVAIIIALILTSAIFTFWIYRETVRPIDKLRLATKNIKDGNLDFDMDTSGEDEFSDLYRDFDAMRRQLKQDQEEKLQADTETRELISNISHDLKTPITAIKGYVEGLLDGVANTPEKQEKYIRIIYSKAYEMDTLINELTFYSKIDNGKVPYNFAKINMSDYFSDCVEEIGIDLENRGVALGYVNDLSAQTRVVADPEQLRRVINNIVNNSVKYIQKTPARISIHLRENDDEVMIAISDNGSGIDEKDVPYIFDRFYRSDASRNSKTGGSGIGLSIVKRIVEDHEGSISCESVLGEGTTMHITLPKYKEGSEDFTQSMEVIVDE